MTTDRRGRSRDYPLQYLLDLSATPDALITPEHAGALTGLEPDTLRKMSHRGDFVKLHRIGHRTMRYRYGDVIDWLRNIADGGNVKASGVHPPASSPPNGAGPAKRS